MTKLSNDQIEDLFTKVGEMRADGAQREGQALMNALYFINADLAAEIHGTDADCFYDDDRVYLFLRRVGVL